MVYVGSFQTRPIIGPGDKLLVPMKLPSAEEQLRFLSNIQRLFAESEFSATYKFALLIALADLAVELGRDDGEELVLSTRQLGERFIYLYWPQVQLYGTGKPGTTPGILAQNHGAQAAVLGAIISFRERNSVMNLREALLCDEYPMLVAQVATTVSAHPLNFLQNFGGTTNEFLYERIASGKVKLHKGVAYFLRRFYPLVQQLARSHWIDHIKGNRQNQPILGEANDLENFLFGASRQSLLRLSDGLRKLDGAKCFYCSKSLTAADVDHFIPFAQYPRDLAHNFVLAHPTCNRSKSDTLAARHHLENWLNRIERKTDALAEIGQDAGLVVDMETSRRIALWGYGNAIDNGGSAWVAPARYELVDASYRNCFV